MTETQHSLLNDAAAMLEAHGFRAVADQIVECKKEIPNMPLSAQSESTQTTNAARQVSSTGCVPSSESTTRDREPAAAAPASLPSAEEFCTCARAPFRHRRHRLCGITGFNLFLGEVQRRLIERGYNPPAWPDSTIRDQGDLDDALDVCTQWCADRLDESSARSSAAGKTRYFWCEKHKVAHVQGDDGRDCLLVGPFSSKTQAEDWDNSKAESSSPLAQQIEKQFPAKLPPDDYQFEFIFSVRLDYRDWRAVLAALRSSARSATTATIEDALKAASPLIRQAWADRCGIDVSDERVQEADKVGWPSDYGLFEAGWNALARALLAVPDREANK